MSNPDYKFEGWMGLDEGSVNGTMLWSSFEPKPWEETDVDIKITHCSICGSDLHTLKNGWKNANYPCCVGHEIIGIAIRVGSKVKDIKIGDRVGVGAQSDSCQGRNGHCEECATGLEQYCSKKFVETYNSVHLNGGRSYGGYALYNRTPAHFVVKIPDAIPSAEAAPMLCAGITTYYPMKHYGCGPGKKVGVIGLGGLGHFGVLWGKALGAEKVVAISRKAGKRADALALGADSYIATEDDIDWAKHNGRSLDLLVCTISSSKSPISDYLALLKPQGTFVQVGNPDDGVLAIPALSLIVSRINVRGSCIGSPEDIREMLRLAAEKKVKPWIEERSMKEANKALVDMKEGKAKYRYVLVNEEHL